MLLEIKNLNVFYGGIHALHDISLEVGKGELITLIGANGAGKTTTLRAISNLVPVSSGEINFKGKPINGLAPSKLVYLGISHVPEGRRIFANLTVFENLELGAYAQKNKLGFKKDLEEIYNRFPRLKERAKQPAGTLSGGEQQMLAMGRALLQHPEILLLDEPSMGLAPIVVGNIFSLIKDIHDSGITILLVEQNAHLALAAADRAYVMENGKIVLSGNAKDLLHNDEVKKAYLGG